MLALEERVVTHNVRISVVHEERGRTWRLRIKQLRESDRGCYMCQINASPMRKQIGCIDVQGELTGGLCLFSKKKREKVCTSDTSMHKQ